jgi:predicted transcriptional regulator
MLWITISGGCIMAINSKRTTIYLDPDLHRALRLKSFTISRSISDIIGEAVRQMLFEDAEDIAAFEARVQESLVSYDEMVKRLKKDGRI